MNAYSSLKAAWHIDRIAELRAGGQSVPPHVQIILSDLCNQDCNFCAYRAESGLNAAGFGEVVNGKWTHNPRRMLPTEVAIGVLDDAAQAGVQAVQFTGGGEPTVHPDHLAIIGHAQSLGLATGLVTNGVRIAEDDVFSRLSWVRVSLDAGEEKTYRKTRRSSAWHTVLRNMGYFGSLPGPYFGVGFVVTGDNWREIIEATEIAVDVGAAYIRFSAMFSADGAKPYRDIYYKAKNHIEVARERFARDGFAVVDLFGDRIEDLEAGAPNYAKCYQQALCTYIGGDGGIYRCCNTAYTDHGRVGSVLSGRFSEWLASPRDVHDFDARSCRFCQFNEKNRILNYLVGKTPMHVEFA